MNSLLEIINFNWQQTGSFLLQTLIYIIEVLFVARVSYMLVVYFLRGVLLKRERKVLFDQRKANTLFPLLRSIAFYVITFTVIVHILQKVFPSFDTGTLLASAGVLGVALGFGSQSLVKDIIGGFFILFEDQFSVGDFIKVGLFSGTVEEIGLRATRLRDSGGELHIIPNGGITAVTNYNRGKMRALVDIQVPYAEDLDRAMEVMHKVCKEVQTEYGEKIIEPPEVQGVIEFGELNVVLRVIAYTVADEQWGLERELRRRIHKAFLAEGIRIPQSNLVITKKNSDVS
ncbi:mechanosensitive ion channel family protein [Desulfitobacterium sp.]|uniref:mechanosensitive ion channel family protein n=1 Tax=Desulfitobacterium sp. TaxID=49981 RepID=UPI002C82586D|nr:mechanosensitive ion channel family protein [Desulfitobacterium sp.]HVJ49130.1 mechanosensitive ion channel family protein [Desulfitobacterium sp.]